MISEVDLQKQEALPLEERILHIENLIKEKEDPRAFELGLLLALKMGKEIKDKKPLGSETGDLVASWSEKFPASIVEESIALAKEFLMHPNTLKEKIKSGFSKFKETEEPREK